MFNKKIILSLILLLLFSSACSLKKPSLSTLETDIIKINKRVKLLNKKLIPKNSTFLECSLQKNKLLKLQEENNSEIDKVLKLNNILAYTAISPKNRKEMMLSLDNALKNLFILREESKKQLLKISTLSIKNKKGNKLCGLELRPIPKIKPCISCKAVFN